MEPPTLCTPTDTVFLVPLVSLLKKKKKRVWCTWIPPFSFWIKPEKASLSNSYVVIFTWVAWVLDGYSKFIWKGCYIFRGYNIILSLWCNFQAWIASSNLFFFFFPKRKINRVKFNILYWELFWTIVKTYSFPFLYMYVKDWYFCATFSSLFICITYYLSRWLQFSYTVFIYVQHFELPCLFWGKF